MSLRTLRETGLKTPRPERPSAVGGAVLWAGTVAYGASTVALLAVLSRHSEKTSFSQLAALLGLSFVVSLVPAGISLRSASLVADGRPPPALTPGPAALITVVSLAVSPILAFLLHVGVLAAGIVIVQMVVAIPLAIRQGALLGRHRFEGLGVNLVIEGVARFVLGAVLGLTVGITGVAIGLCAGTVVALLAMPEWRSDVTLVDRPRTSLTATSASLALLGLFVQLDVLIAPSVVSHGGATAYDLAAVPSKGVYLALLAIGPLIFPSVRGRPDRRLVVGAVLAAGGFGVACTAVLVAGRHLIGAVLGRPAAGPLELALLGLAMTLAGITGIALSAGIARGQRQPWPPLALGIAVMLLWWPFRPGVLAFSAVVAACQAVTMFWCVANCIRGTSPMVSNVEPVMEMLAEAGDPLATAQAIRTLPDNDSTAPVARSSGVSSSGAVEDTVAVIIPTFRRPEYLRRLLETVTTSTQTPDEIIVVDNDPEGSVEVSDLPPHVQLVHAGYGINVTAARNAGWRASRSDVCIFVDDDNEVDDGCIPELASACRDERVGLAGPVIYSGDEGTIWCAGIEYSKWTGISRCKWIGESEPPDPRARWATVGMPDVYALRREVLERVGGLDDVAFPMCGEEFDLGERVGALGLERVVVRDAKVRHYGNVSENPAVHLVRSATHHGAERAHLMARSRVRVQRRHSHGPSRWTTLLLFVPLWAVVSMLACLRVPAPWHIRWMTIRAIAAGLAEGYREAPLR